MDHLKAYCEERGLPLTQPRISVYGVLNKSKTAHTAYAVLEALSVEGARPKPPTIYRALEFLTQHGFVHRIESLNAYIVCHETHQHRGSQFLICDSCGQVEEIHLCHVPDTLKNVAAEKNFSLRYWNTELHGQCGVCAKMGSDLEQQNCAE